MPAPPPRDASEALRRDAPALIPCDAPELIPCDASEALQRDAPEPIRRDAPEPIRRDAPELIPCDAPELIRPGVHQGAPGESFVELIQCDAPELIRRDARAARAEVIAGSLLGAALRDRLLAVPLLDRDAWVDSLLGIEEPAPPDVSDLPRGAVPYLPCGVAEILTAVHELPLGPADELVDIGAGLGRVMVLAHLLSGALARGVELQAPLVERARVLAASLGLAAPAVSFLHADAANTALDGSVFFLYAPCNGAMLARVLGQLEAVSRRRAIAVCAVDLVLDGATWLSARPTALPSLVIYESRR